MIFYLVRIKAIIDNQVFIFFFFILGYLYWFSKFQVLYIGFDGFSILLKNIFGKIKIYQSSKANIWFYFYYSEY